MSFSSDPDSARRITSVTFVERRLAAEAESGGGPPTASASAATAMLAPEKHATQVQAATIQHRPHSRNLFIDRLLAPFLASGRDRNVVHHRHAFQASCKT